MGTTIEKLQGIVDSKEDIRLAINAKGVEVDTDVALSQYAERIDQIPVPEPGGNDPDNSAELNQISDALDDINGEII
jgi:hypothetical protein